MSEALNTNNQNSNENPPSAEKLALEILRNLNKTSDLQLSEKDMESIAINVAAAYLLLDIEEQSPEEKRQQVEQLVEEELAKRENTNENQGHSNEVVSSEEFAIFVDSGFVAEDILIKIAGKIASGKDLSREELAIQASKGSEIEDFLKKIKEAAEQKITGEEPEQNLESGAENQEKPIFDKAAVTKQILEEIERQEQELELELTPEKKREIFLDIYLKAKEEHDQKLIEGSKWKKHLNKFNEFWKSLDNNPWKKAIKTGVHSAMIGIAAYMTADVNNIATRIASRVTIAVGSSAAMSTFLSGSKLGDSKSSKLLKGGLMAAGLGVSFAAGGLAVLGVAGAGMVTSKVIEILAKNNEEWKKRKTEEESARALEGFNDGYSVEGLEAAVDMFDKEYEKFSKTHKKIKTMTKGAKILTSLVVATETIETMDKTLPTHDNEPVVVKQEGMVSSFAKQDTQNQSFYEDTEMVSEPDTTINPQDTKIDTLINPQPATQDTMVNTNPDTIREGGELSEVKIIADKIENDSIGQEKYNQLDQALEKFEKEAEADGDVTDIGQWEDAVKQAKEHYLSAKEYYENAGAEGKEPALESMQHAKAELEHQQQILAEKKGESLVNEPIIDPEEGVARPYSTRIDQEQLGGGASGAPEGYEKPAEMTEEDWMKKFGIVLEEKEKEFSDTEGEGEPDEGVYKFGREAKPENNSPIGLEDGERPTAYEVNDAAVVKTGEGITYAFREQLRANPAIAKDLGADMSQLNDDMYMARFTRNLAIKTGYMDEAGHEIRVKAGGVAAYSLNSTPGGEPIVTEYEVTKNPDGTWSGKISDSFHKGPDQSFETNIEHKYEYSDGIKHTYEKPKTIADYAPPTQEDPTEPLTKPEMPVDEDEDFSAPPQKAPELPTDIEEAPENKSEEKIEKPEEPADTKKQDSHQQYLDAVRKMRENPSKGYYETKGGYEVGDGYNIGEGAEEGSGGSSPEANLKTTAGFENVKTAAIIHGYKDMSDAQIEEVNKVYKQNLQNIFGKNNGRQFDQVDEMSVKKFMKMNPNQMTEAERGLQQHIEKIEDVTRIEPRRSAYFTGQRETVQEYLLRGTLAAEDSNVLEKITISEKHQAEVPPAPTIQPSTGYTEDNPQNQGGFNQQREGVDQSIATRGYQNPDSDGLQGPARNEAAPKPTQDAEANTSTTENNVEAKKYLTSELMKMKTSDFVEGMRSGTIAEDDVTNSIMTNYLRSLAERDFPEADVADLNLAELVKKMNHEAALDKKYDLKHYDPTQGQGESADDQHYDPYGN